MRRTLKVKAVLQVSKKGKQYERKIQRRKKINMLAAYFLFYYAHFFFPKRLPLLQLVRNITFLDVSKGFI